MRKLLLVALCTIALLGCTDVTVTGPTIDNESNNNSRNSGGSSGGGGDTSGGTLPEGAYIRVGIFGFGPQVECAGLNNGTATLPVACEAHVTCTPKDQNGNDLDEAVHGPKAEWKAEQQPADAVSIEVPGNAPVFNRDVRGVRAGTLRLSCTVKNKTGTLDLTVR